MYDIVFINPPNHCQTDYVPLGLQNLYTLVKDIGIYTYFIDLQNSILHGELEYSRDVLQRIRDLVASKEAKVYAFTIWNTSLPWVIDIAEYIKENQDNTVIIAGGPLVTLCHKQILEDYRCIDICCRYEGELIIEPLVKTLLGDDHVALEDIANISYRNGKESIHTTHNAPLIEDLDVLPWLEPILTDWKSPVINIEAGRGCSFHCYYCSSCYIWKYKPRYKSGKRIFAEIQKIYDEFKKDNRTPPVVHLEHDNFLMNKQVLHQLNDAIHESGQQFKYGFAGRADLISEINLELLQKSGCFYVYLGIETGSPRLQKIIKKNLSFKKVYWAVENLQKRGIIVNANLMYGFPEEELADLYSTLDVITTLRFLGVNVYISMLSPELHTPVGETASLDTYIYNPSSRYAHELQNCGFDPRQYKEIYVNHLYTLKNEHYDILLMDAFVRFWCGLVSDYPVTMYFLTEGIDYEWGDIVSLWRKQRKQRNMERELESDFSANARAFFRSQVVSSGFNQIREEIVLIEQYLARNKKAGTNCNELSLEQVRAYHKEYNAIRKSTLGKLRKD